MKKKSLSLLIAGMVLVPSVVGASGFQHTNADVTTSLKASLSADIQSEAGLLPGDSLYFADRWMENLQLAVTSDAETEARLWADIAKERYAEWSLLDGEAKGKFEAELKADYESGLKLALRAMTQAKENTRVKFGEATEPTHPVAEAKTNIGAAADVKVESKNEAEAKAEAKSKTEVKSRTEVKSKTVAGVESNSSSRTEAGTDVKASAKIDSNVKVQSELEELETEINQLVDLGLKLGLDL
jgi:hypothetical protein